MNDELQSAIYRLLKRFVSRQVLALRAIEEMRPHFILIAKRERPIEEILTEMLNEIKRPQAPQSGYTGDNNEWEYFFHGGGCQLTHTVTQEIIDWDAPDVKTFDRFWFLNWLEWLLDYEATNEDAAIVQKAFDSYNGTFREFVFEQIRQYEESGLIKRSGSSRNKYMLI